MLNGHDVIIVGGGLAGLTAAAQLATGGHRPLLLERHHQLGGQARTDELGGCLFNRGPHALYRKGAGLAILNGLGVDPQGFSPPLSGAQLDRAQGLTALPATTAGLLRTGALTVREKAQFGWLMASLPRLDPVDYADVTVDEWLGAFLPGVRAIARAFTRLSTYSTATDSMSADAAIGQLQGSSAGVLYVDGGWAAIVGALATMARDAGATITTGAKVTAIVEDPDPPSQSTNDEPNRSRHIVTCDGVEYRAAAVIVACGPPSVTASILEAGSDQPATDPFASAGPAPAAAVLDLVLETPPQHRFVLGLDSPTYFSVHSPPAPLDVRYAAVAMRYLSPSDERTVDQDRAELSAVARSAGATQPVEQRFLRSMTVTGGQPLAENGGLGGRPPVTVPGRRNVFVAGDWVGPIGLLADAAIASGHAAANAVGSIRPVAAATR